MVDDKPALSDTLGKFGNVERAAKGVGNPPHPLAP